MRSDYLIDLIQDGLSIELILKLKRSTNDDMIRQIYSYLFQPTKTATIMKSFTDFRNYNKYQTWFSCRNIDNIGMDIYSLGLTTEHTLKKLRELCDGNGITDYKKITGSTNEKKIKMIKLLMKV
jgi:hypothetical protein